MSEISETIDAVIEPLRSVMKHHGFAKSGRTWRRRGEGHVQVLNVQASGWNTGERGSFTVNLGVYFAAVDEIVGEFRARSAPSEMHCQVRQRIGQLMPAGNDHWWEVRPGSPLLDVADDVVLAVTTLGLPWLDAHSSLESALAAAGTPAYWLSDVHAAAMCIALERPEEAAVWLAQLRDRFLKNGRPALAERWLAWGRERGVVVA